MPESEGIVASVSEDGEAEVVIQESELCIHCASEIEVCNCSGVSSRLVINALNSIGASVGDMVSISHKPGALMKSVAIFLVIPAIGLIAGFVTVPILNQSFTMDGIRTALIAAAGLSIGIIVSVLTYRRVSADIQPIISCKMEVDPATAAGHMTYNGKSYYFCRAGCLETFMKDPAKDGEG
jgi:YHS domain-containing protein